MTLAKADLQALGVRLEAQGLRQQDLTKFVDSGGMASLDCVPLVAQIRARISNGEQPVAHTDQIETNHAAAEAIMGSNFLGIAEIEQAFGVKFTPAQRQKLAIIPDKLMQVLKACAKTHVLVAGFPLSIIDVRAKVAGHTEKLFCSPTGTGWYNEQAFAGVQVECRWYLLRKEPLPNSTSKWYNEQEATVAQLEEEIPWARDVVFATMALFLTTGERLFERICVRCKDVTSLGSRVRVGSFDQDGFHINYWSGKPHDGVAVASLRNS